MNPDQNRSGMPVQSLMLMGLLISTGVPTVAIASLAFIYTQTDPKLFLPFVALLALIVLLIVFLSNHLIQRRIRNRFLSLVEVCQDFANGDRTVRAGVSGDDDFAKLSLSLNTLLETQGSGPGSLGGAQSMSDAAALQAQIEKLLQEVSAVGDGDLRVQAEVTPDTLGVLADSFNYMIEELAKVVGRVQSTAVQVTNATRRILDRSAELAQASETQVKQISQTTEAVEALAVFIQNVARNAQMSVEAAQDALHNAASGQQAVRQTIEGMMVIRENVQETSKKIKRLGERSNEIGEIVRIIEDIADQTNLLALNAAIQSAMAGEHGRGFAVVADEIRLLAERSTESTKRIATLVKSIQGDTYEAVVAMEDSTQEVVKGSQLADDAGRSLNSIYGAVERQAQMIESIARAANEQTSVSEAVAVAMGRISEITRQTDAGTQEAAVSVSYLAELSEQLRASVSTFRLPDRTNDMFGTFSPMTAIAEVQDNRNNQSYATAGDQGWNSGFSSGAFPPLPEPGNSGSLVSMGSRAGQFDFANQQDYGQQMPGNGLPLKGMQQPQLPAQAQFGGQAFFGNANGNNNNQLDFGDLASFESQPGFTNGYNDQAFNQGQGFAPPNQSFNQGQGFAPPNQSFNQGQGFAPPNQSFNQGQGFAPPNQPFSQGPNPGMGNTPAANNSAPLPAPQQPAGQNIPTRPRWQGNSPQDPRR